MSGKTEIKYLSPVLKEAADSVSEADRAAFDLNFRITERLRQILLERGMTRRELARATGRKESEVSRWFMLGHNFTTRTIATIQQALGVPLIQVTR